MEAATLLGAAATVCSTASFLPQAWKVIRSRDTTAISGTMYSVTVVGFALWLGYGVVLGAWPLIVTNSVCLLLSAFILLMKLAPPQRKRRIAEALDPTPAPHDAAVGCDNGNCSRPPRHL